MCRLVVVYILESVNLNHPFAAKYMKLVIPRDSKPEQMICTAYEFVLRTEHLHSSSPRADRS